MCVCVCVCVCARVCTCVRVRARIQAFKMHSIPLQPSHGGAYTLTTVSTTPYPLRISLLWIFLSLVLPQLAVAWFHSLEGAADAKLQHKQRAAASHLHKQDASGRYAAHLRKRPWRGEDGGTGHTQATGVVILASAAPCLPCLTPHAGAFNRCAIHVCCRGATRQSPTRAAPCKLDRSTQVTDGQVIVVNGGEEQER